MNRRLHRAGRRRQEGFGLVELMIAMTLGLFVLAGVYEVFLSNKTTYRAQQSLSRLQENGRYAVQTLARGIRMAGFAGCARLDNQSINIIANGVSPTGFGPATAITGVDNVAAGNATNILPDTDTVTLQGASAEGMELTGNMKDAKADLEVSSNPDNLKAGSLVFVSDCSGSDLFAASKVSSNNGNSKVKISHKKKENNGNKSLSKAYQSNAFVGAFAKTRYYLKNSTTATFPDGTFVPALWRGRNGVATELVSGIQDMQIEYGVNTDGDSQNSADQYVTANNVTDWSKVVSVRVALLLESLTPGADVADNASTYTLNKQAVGPFNDRYLRRAVTFTVAIRNRVH